MQLVRAFVLPFFLNGESDKKVELNFAYFLRTLTVLFYLANYFTVDIRDSKISYKLDYYNPANYN